MNKVRLLARKSAAWLKHATGKTSSHFSGLKQFARSGMVALFGFALMFGGIDFTESAEIELLDEKSQSDTYPTIRIGESDADMGHEATVSKVGDDMLFYLQSRGLSEEEASKMIVNGFIEPVTKELPMEYAVELNRLIELQMEGSIG